MADEAIVEQASSDKQQPQPPDEEDEGACKIIPNFEHSFERCFLCGLEHDSPEFGPYCALCHDFLYPNVLLLRERQTVSVDCATSAEAVSSQSAASESGEIAVCSGAIGLESEDGECESESKDTSEMESNSVTCTTNCESTSVSRYKLPYLSLYERVRAPDLVAERLASELNFVEEDLFETLPPESECLYQWEFSNSLSSNLFVYVYCEFYPQLSLRFAPIRNIFD